MDIGHSNHGTDYVLVYKIRYPGPPINCFKQLIKHWEMDKLYPLFSRGFVFNAVELNKKLQKKETK